MIGPPGETEAGSAGTQPCRGIAGPTVRRWTPARAPVDSCYRGRVTHPLRPSGLDSIPVGAFTGVPGETRNTRLWPVVRLSIEHQSHALINPVAWTATLRARMPTVASLYSRRKNPGSEPSPALRRP